MAEALKEIFSATPKQAGEERCTKGAIKIAHVISRLCVGGTSVQVVLVAEALRREGFSTLLLAGNLSFGEGSLEDFAEIRGVSPVKIQGLSREISLWKDFTALYRLVQLFRKERPLVVHTHTAKAGALGRIAARLVRVPVCVHTFHGHVFRGHFSPAKSRIFLAIEKMLAHWTDCIVALCETQRRELVDVYHVSPANKVVTIPVGIEMDRFLSINGYQGSIRRVAHCPPNKAVVGWVGRLATVKNPELFLEAARLSLQGSRETHFIMVGDGNLRPSLEAYSKQQDISNSITMLNWQSDLSSLYADVDVMVLTSRHEGTPLVLLEAMASGKPFVATDVGGVRDLMMGKGRVMNGYEIFENGILTDSTPRSVAAAIEYILDNRERALQMGRCGRTFALESYSHHRLSKDLEHLYLRLLKKKSPAKFLKLCKAPHPAGRSAGQTP